MRGSLVAVLVAVVSARPSAAQQMSPPPCNASSAAWVYARMDTLSNNCGAFYRLTGHGLTLFTQANVSIVRHPIGATCVTAAMNDMNRALTSVGLSQVRPSPDDTRDICRYLAEDMSLYAANRGLPPPVEPR